MVWGRAGPTSGRRLREKNLKRKLNFILSVCDEVKQKRTVSGHTDLRLHNELIFKYMVWFICLLINENVSGFIKHMLYARIDS